MKIDMFESLFVTLPSLVWNSSKDTDEVLTKLPLFTSTQNTFTSKPSSPNQKVAYELSSFNSFRGFGIPRQ